MFLVVNHILLFCFDNANVHKDTTTSDSYTIESYDVTNNNDTNSYYKQIGNAGVITRVDCSEPPPISTTKYLKIQTSVNSVCGYNTIVPTEELISQSFDERTTIFYQGDTSDPSTLVVNYQIDGGNIVVDKNTNKSVIYDDPFTD